MQNGEISADLAGGVGVTLTKTGAGTVTLSGMNTYEGGTTVNDDGTLVLNHATDTLLDTGAVTVDGPDAILDLNGNTDTVGAVTLIEGSISNGTLTGDSYDVQNGLGRLDRR